MYVGSEYIKSDGGRAVSAGAVLVGGSTVTWFARMQQCVTLSTTEAEYVAIGECVKAAICVHNVVGFMQPGVAGKCVRVYEDSAGATALARTH